MNQAHAQLTWWASVWPLLQPYIPLFALVVAIIIPLSASFFGAWTAQRIADRNRFRDDISKEIRNTNAAISLAFTLCNTAMALKRQHVTRIWQEFEEARADFLEHVRKRQIGQIQGNAEYRFTMPLMTLTPPKLATDSLRSMVLDRLSAVGRPLHLAAELSESSATLIACMETRNAQIEDNKKSDSLNIDGGAQRFFGLPFGGGHQDLTNQHLLEAIVSTTDDLIYFSLLLCRDLQKHGAKLVDNYRMRLGSENLPHITELDFSPRVADGTIPSAEKYQDWTTNFPERKVAPTRWQRIRHPFASRVIIG